MEPKQHLSHFISPEHALFYQNTLYSPKKLNSIRTHFISSDHTLFHQITFYSPDQRPFYFIRTHFISSKHILFTGRHFISSEHTLFLSEHSLFHQNTFYSPYHVLITKCMLTKCTTHFSHQNPLESANVTLNTKKEARWSKSAFRLLASSSSL